MSAILLPKAFFFPCFPYLVSYMNRRWINIRHWQGKYFSWHDNISASMFKFICWRKQGRGRKKEMERMALSWFTPHIPRMARALTSIRPSPGIWNLSQVPSVGGTNSITVAFQCPHEQEAEGRSWYWEWNPCSVMWEVSISATRPNACLQFTIIENLMK